MIKKIVHFEVDVDALFETWCCLQLVNRTWSYPSLLTIIYSTRLDLTCLFHAGYDGALEIAEEILPARTLHYRSNTLWLAGKKRGEAAQLSCKEGAQETEEGKSQQSSSLSMARCRTIRRWRRRRNGGWQYRNWRRWYSRWLQWKDRFRAAYWLWRPMRTRSRRRRSIGLPEVLPRVQAGRAGRSLLMVRESKSRSTCRWSQSSLAAACMQFASSLLFAYMHYTFSLTSVSFSPFFPLLMLHCLAGYTASQTDFVIATIFVLSVQHSQLSNNRNRMGQRKLDRHAGEDNGLETSPWIIPNRSRASITRPPRKDVRDKWFNVIWLAQKKKRTEKEGRNKSQNYST